MIEGLLLVIRGSSCRPSTLDLQESGIYQEPDSLSLIQDITDGIQDVIANIRSPCDIVTVGASVTLDPRPKHPGT